jgi:hypothetical protein
MKINNRFAKLVVLLLAVNSNLSAQADHIGPDVKISGHTGDAIANW